METSKIKMEEEDEADQMVPLMDPVQPAKSVLDIGIPSMMNYDIMVTLYAGDTEKNVIVYRDYACYYSPVLKTFFDGIITQGQPLVFRIPDVTPEAVRLFAVWLAMLQLDLVNTPNANGDPCQNISETSWHQHLALVELWVLAEKLSIPRLQNQVMREIKAIWQRFKLTPTHCLPFLYQKTVAGSPLRRLFVDMIASAMPTVGLTKPFEDRFPNEMLLELVVRLFEATPQQVRNLLLPDAHISAGRYSVPEL